MKNLDKVKIGLFDIETTANEGAYWGKKWETDIIETFEHSKILSYSAEIIGGKKITKGWPDFPKYKKGVKDDEKIVKDIWNLFNGLDIIIAHNGKDFDFKVCNTRFLYYKLTPPEPSKLIDTKIEAKKYLNLPSYSLDDICNYYGIGHKLPHQGWPLWKGCVAGNPKDWATMKKYNKHDVDLLRGVYLLLRPWIKNHPNLNLFNDTSLSCPNCGSNHVTRQGFDKTLVGKYQQFQCQDCGRWIRGESVKIDRVLR
jgi:DNA polymerase elongation subunit (family B)/predicted RNA-binding Zn-ribbon protein involved in translation (DUF1610 family)